MLTWAANVFRCTKTESPHSRSYRPLSRQEFDKQTATNSVVFTFDTALWRFEMYKLPPNVYP